MQRRTFLGTLVLLIASGCAQRADWIEGTLVTVDVTGRWDGTYDEPLSGGRFDMTLDQTGQGDRECRADRREERPAHERAHRRNRQR